MVLSPDPASAALAAAESSVGTRRASGLRHPRKVRILVTTTSLDLHTDLSDAIRDLIASAVHQPRSEHETAMALVALACEHLPYDHAGIVLRERNGGLRTVAVTDPDLERADAAAALGLSGVVSFRLVEQVSPTGVLNLYSISDQPLSTDDLDRARTFANEASLALRVSGELWHLNQALAHRTVISQAVGWMMGRYGLEEVQSLSALKRISSHSNRRLHVVASEILSTQQLTDPVSPRTDGPRPPPRSLPSAAS